MRRSASARRRRGCAGGSSRGQRGRGAAPPAPPTGAALAALAQPPARTPIASERDLLRHAGPLRERRSGERPRRPHGRARRAPATTRPTPAGSTAATSKGLTGDCTTRGTRPRPDQGARLHGDLGDAAVRPEDRAGLERRRTTATGASTSRRSTRTSAPSADFAAFVDCAHRLGLKVYLDVVVNHTADVILPTGGSAGSGPTSSRTATAAGKPFDPARYAVGTHVPVPARRDDAARRRVVLAAERSAKRPAWLNDVRRYHNRGDIDFGSCSELCFEQGDFFGLDDLFTEQPTVVHGLAEIYAGWIRRYKVDGFRIDTARHVDRAFFTRLGAADPARRRVRPACPDFQLFGEVFVTNAIDLVRLRARPRAAERARLPAPGRRCRASRPATRRARGIASRLADDDYFLLPNGAAPHAADVPRQPRHGPRARCRSAPARGVGGAALLRRVAARPRPALPAARRAGRLLRRRGRDHRPRRRQGGPPGPVPDAGARSGRREERVGAPPIGTRLVLRRHRAIPSRERLRALARAARRAPGALDRRERRAPRRGERPRRQPDRRGRAARVPGRVQRRHGAARASRCARRRRASALDAAARAAGA